MGHGNWFKDSVRITFPTIWQGEQIKMWSENYFMYVGKWKNDKEEFDVYGGGTFTLEDTNYTEYVKYCETKDWVNMEFKMTMVFMNDTVFQTYHPLDTLGNQNTDVTILEKYVRH